MSATEIIKLTDYRVHKYLNRFGQDMNTFSLISTYRMVQISNVIYYVGKKKHESQYNRVVVSHAIVKDMNCFFSVFSLV